MSQLDGHRQHRQFLWASGVGIVVGQSVGIARQRPCGADQPLLHYKKRLKKKNMFIRVSIKINSYQNKLN